MFNLIFAGIVFFLGMFSLAFFAQIVVMHYFGQNFFLGFIASMSASIGFSVVYMPHLQAAYDDYWRKHDLELQDSEEDPPKR